MQVTDLEQGRNADAAEVAPIAAEPTPVEQGGVDVTDKASANPKPEVAREMVDTTVIMQQSGYATDVVALKDVNGNVHCTTFHVHFTGFPSQWGARGHKVKVFVNGAAEAVDALDMTLPASGPLGQCSFAFGRDKPEARQLRDVDFQGGCNTLRFVYNPPQPEHGGGPVGLGKRPGPGIAIGGGNGPGGGASTTTAYFVECKLYVWQATDKVVVTDIDGTLTTTDLMGHIKTVRLANYQYAHKGACGFFSSLAGYGFKVYYLTARPITWMNETRAFLANVRQDGMALPPGPICCSTHHTAEKLVRSLFGIEYADRIKTRFLNGLHDVFARAGRDYTRFGRPLIAGFGNSRTDTRAYKNAHIPFRFNINKKSVMTMEVEAAKVSGSGRSSSCGGDADGDVPGRAAGATGGGKRGSARARVSSSPRRRQGSPRHRRAAGSHASADKFRVAGEGPFRRRAVQRLKLGEWNVLQDTDAFLGHNAYDMSAADLEKCRLTCERMGFGGFAVWNNRAYFRKQSPASCFEARRRLARAQFHLAPLFESEIQDIHSRYARDGEEFMLTEESQSDAQEQGSEVDENTVSESEGSDATGTATPAAASRSCGPERAPGDAVLQTASSGSVAAAATTTATADDAATSSGSAEGTAATLARDADADEQGEVLDRDSLDSVVPHDALSEIGGGLFGGGDDIVAAFSTVTAGMPLAATAMATTAATTHDSASRPVPSPAEGQSVDHSDSADSAADTSDAGDGGDDADTDDDAAEAAASAAAAARPHRTNRPSAESLTTRMFNTVKSLIPQFINLLASPVGDDVDTALAGLQQLKVTEGHNLAKLEQLQMRQQQRRMSQSAIANSATLAATSKRRPVAKGPPADHGHDAGVISAPGEPSGQDVASATTAGTDAVALDDHITTTATATERVGAKTKAAKPAEKDKPVSTSAFLSFFTNGLGNNSVNSAANAKAAAAAEQPSFDSFQDPKLHLIMDIMSVQRAR